MKSKLKGKELKATYMSEEKELDLCEDEDVKP